MATELNGKGSELGVYIVIPKLPGVKEQSELTDEVVIRFIDQPHITETRAARYNPQSLLNAFQAYNAYEGTDSRQFNVQSKFFCQTNEDVITNNRILNVVRSLVKPDYNNTGHPPLPVRLYAYGTTNIHGLPCIVQDYTMDYPNEVDYAVSDDGSITMPIAFELGVTLVEQHSIIQLRNFSLEQFRRGEMIARGF